MLYFNIYIYMKAELTSNCNCNFHLFTANGKRKPQTSVYVQQTENRTNKFIVLGQK
jgi:hypothetical protein